MSAWVSQLARDLEIDTSLLATRADIEALLADATGRPPGHRLAGRAGRRAHPPLVAGEAALAFDGHGGLVLEPARSTALA